MTITGQLDEKGTKKLAGRIGWSYLVASLGEAVCGAAALIYVVRWW